MTDIANDISKVVQQEAIHGEMLAEVSRSVVRLHKELYGKGPTKARSHMLGDVLLCVLAGGLTRAELTLIAGGKGALVRRQREELMGLARERFTATIQSITNRTVLGFLSAIDEQAQLSCEVFVLEPRPEGPGGDGASSDGSAQSHDGSGPSSDGAGHWHDGSAQSHDGSAQSHDGDGARPTG